MFSVLSLICFHKYLWMLTFLSCALWYVYSTEHCIPRCVNMFDLIAGWASTSLLSPDYVPTINMGYDKENMKTHKLQKGHHDSAERRERHRSERVENNRVMSAAASALIDMSVAANCYDDDRSWHWRQPPKVERYTKIMVDKPCSINYSTSLI